MLRRADAPSSTPSCSGRGEVLSVKLQGQEARASKQELRGVRFAGLCHEIAEGGEREGCRGKRGNSEGGAYVSVEARIAGKLGTWMWTRVSGKSILRENTPGRWHVFSPRRCVTVNWDYGSLDDRQTVGQYLAAWIETVKPQIRNSSWRRYGDYVRVHLMPELGRIALTHLSPQHIQLFYARKLNQGLSALQLFITSHAMLHRALKDAVGSWDSSSGMSASWLVRAATPERQRDEDAQGEEQCSILFLKVTEHDRFRCPLRVSVERRAMREGELLGFEWQDYRL